MKWKLKLDPEILILINKIVRTTMIICLTIPVILFAVIISFHVSLNDDQGDIRNWVSLVAEVAIGLIITFSLFYYTNFNQKKVSQLIENTNQIITKQNESAEARKKFAISEIRKGLMGAKNILTEYEQLKEDIQEGNTSTRPNFTRDLEVLLRGLRIAFNGNRFIVTTYAEAFNVEQTREIHLISSEGLGYASPEHEGVARQTGSNLIREIDDLLQMLPAV